MARTVYLHIGLPKTGTTFLQTTMWRNRAALRRQGILYPGRGRLDHYHASQEVRGAPAAKLGENVGVWRRLVDELAAWQGDGLVSHEFFSMATPEQARAAVAALAPAEVRVVVTLRSYVLQFPALWQEALKMHALVLDPVSGRSAPRAAMGFDEFMKLSLDDNLRGGWSWQSQDIPRVLGRWSDAVSTEQITVVTVPPPGSPRELLWQRWRDAVGFDDSEFDLDVSHANESLGASQAALLLRVKPHLSGPLLNGRAQHRWVRKYFGHQVLVPQRGERFGPRPHHVAELAERARSAKDWIQRQGFQVVGDLGDLAATTTPTGTHPDDVPDAEIVEVAARAIEQMIRDIQEVTTERDRLRAEIERLAPAGRPTNPPRALVQRVAARIRGRRQR